MVEFRESSVDADDAHELLAEYFAFRAAGFPAAQGSYRIVFPTAAHFEPPRGAFLIVEDEGLLVDDAGAAVGCGGIRLIDLADHPAAAEIKHLWLQPPLRGRGIGRQLLAELERRAVALGAQSLVLDTNESLTAAGALYRSSGFAEVPPYNDNVNATTWFAKRL